MDLFGQLGILCSIGIILVCVFTKQWGIALFLMVIFAIRLMFVQ
jgi:hypothetical protein